MAGSYTIRDLELSALLKQGFEEDEARALVRHFSEGRNPDGRFVFHFTKAKCAKGILKEGFKPGGVGYGGRAGVYATTASAPRRLFKFFVLGLWRKPVRIPIDVQKHPVFQRLRWPLKTVFCGLRMDERLVLGTGIVKWESR